MFSGDLASNHRIGQPVPYLERSLDQCVVKLDVDKFDSKENIQIALNLATLYLAGNHRFVQSINAKAMAYRTQPKLLKLEGNEILAEQGSQNLWKWDSIFYFAPLFN